jgi:hypothetical protein
MRFRIISIFGLIMRHGNQLKQNNRPFSVTGFRRNLKGNFSFTFVNAIFWLRIRQRLHRLKLRNTKSTLRGLLWNEGESNMALTTRSELHPVPKTPS